LSTTASWQRTQTPEGRTRLEMLATIREFALAELDASADAETVRARSRSVLHPTRGGG
jgi:predicted ATPase